MTDERKIRHHFIPGFYLRGFTDPIHDNLVWVYNKGTDNIFSGTPESIGFEKHYHTFETVDGNKDTNTIEDYFCHVWEGPVAKIFEQIKAGDFPEGNVREFFACFLGLSLTRSPNHRVNIDKVSAHFIKSFSQFSASNPEYFANTVRNYEREMGEKLTDDPEDLRKYILGGQYDVKMKPELYLKMFISHGINLGIVISKMKWVFVRATDRFRFITSDNPFSFHDPTIRQESFYNGTGLLNKNVEVSFPISKDIALLATWRDSITEGYVQGTHELVKVVNRCSVAAAHRAVYASEKSEALLRLVKKYGTTSPTIMIS